MNAREQVEAPLALIQQSAYAALDEYEKHGAATPCLDSRIPHPLDNQRNTIDLWGIIRNLEGACDQLCCTLAPPAHTIANRAQDHYWACIRFATKSRIVNTLADHPKGLHVRDLAEMVGIGQDKLTTILRLLAAKHCFREGCPLCCLPANLSPVSSSCSQMIPTEEHILIYVTYSLTPNTSATHTTLESRL